MKDLHENFAAIAVMSGLYESKKDIYDVLAVYLQVVIESEKMNNFTAADITEKLNQTNSFRVSEPIVKTSLRRLGLKLTHGYYTVDESYNSIINSEDLDEQIRQNKILVEKLYHFIEKEQDAKLSSEEKQIVQNKFYNYLMNPESEDKYSVSISNFIMDSSLDSDIYNVILRIKEGLLVYEGICFSPEFSQSGKWDFRLDIFFELEVIFYVAGFNGELHKEMYLQLIDYVNELNSLPSAPSGKWIKLYYLEDVKLEIENYFSTAELIFEKQEVIDPSKKAMMYILDGVTSKSDIQIKKVKLYHLLNRMGIHEYKTNFYAEENNEFNIVTDDVYRQNCERINSDKGEEYIKKCTDKINQINILRKNRNGTLRDAGKVLLTANGTIFKCAYMENAYNEGEAPKAVNIDYLINRFWYRLNKGFGKGDGPKSIDIISRARMIIASMTVEKVSQAYEELKKKYAEGKLTDTEVASIMNELRRVSKNPEDVTSEQISFLKDYELTNKIENIRREEIARQHDLEKINKLTSQLDELERKRIQEEHDHKEAEKSFEQRIQLLENKNTQNEQEKEKLNNTIRELLDRETKRRLLYKKILRGSIWIICTFIIAAVLFVLGKYLFRADRSISGLISIILTIVFQFFATWKGLWKKYVTDCKLGD